MYRIFIQKIIPDMDKSTIIMHHLYFFIQECTDELVVLSKDSFLSFFQDIFKQTRDQNKKRTLLLREFQTQLEEKAPQWSLEDYACSFNDIASLKPMVMRLYELAENIHPQDTFFFAEKKDFEKRGSDDDAHVEYFIHETNLNIARQLWKEPDLIFRTVAYRDMERKKDIERIIEDCIRKTIRHGCDLAHFQYPAETLDSRKEEPEEVALENEERDNQEISLDREEEDNSLKDEKTNQYTIEQPITFDHESTSSDDTRSTASSHASSKPESASSLTKENKKEIEGMIQSFLQKKDPEEKERKRLAKKKRIEERKDKAHRKKEKKKAIRKQMFDLLQRPILK